MSEHEPDIRGSLREYEEFVRSNIWRDMQSEFGAWLESIRDSLEVTEDPDELRLFQGNAKSIRNVLQFPERVIEAYKEDENGNK